MSSVPDEDEQLIDALAELEHRRWAHWQTYLHSVAERRPDGAIVIPADYVSRWQRQIDTPFPDLSKEEQESDRQLIRKDLAELRRIFGVN